MPSGAGRYRFAAAAAAVEPPAGLGDRQGLRKGVDVDVGLMASANGELLSRPRYRGQTHFRAVHEDQVMPSLLLPVV